MTISVMELVRKVGTVAKVSSLLTGTVCMVWCALRASLCFGFNHKLIAIMILNLRVTLLVYLFIRIVRLKSLICLINYIDAITI